MNDTRITVIENAKNELDIDISDGNILSLSDIYFPYRVSLALQHIRWWFVLIYFIFLTKILKLRHKES